MGCQPTNWQTEIRILRDTTSIGTLLGSTGMKRQLVMSVATVMAVVLMGGCGSSETTSSSGGWESISETSTESGTSDEMAEETTTTSGDVTIEETVLYDANDIKVTATRFDADALLGPELQILIENNSAQNYVIQADYCVVNGYMITDLLSADIAAGKKSNESMTFLSSTLERCGINTITDIRIDLKVIDPDTYQTLFTMGEATLNTSAAGSYTQSYDDSGVELYNENGIRVVALGIADDLLGKSVRFYVENNSAQHIAVSGDNVSVNGFMVTELMYSDCVANARDVAEMTLLSSELEQNGITDITEIDLTLRISDADTFQTIAETSGTLTLN